MLAQGCVVHYLGNCTLLIELLEEVSKKYKTGTLDAESFGEFLDTAKDLSASMLKKSAGHLNYCLPLSW